MKTEVVGARMQQYDLPGSLGVVTDTVYRQCFWASPDQPYSPFADGSSGIEVQGPPTPRNIIFPPDTVFLAESKGDRLFARTEPTPALESIKDDPTYQVADQTAVQSFSEDLVVVMMTYEQAVNQDAAVAPHHEAIKTGRKMIVDALAALKAARAKFAAEQVARLRRT